MFQFVLYRISMLFLCLFLILFLPRHYSVKKSIWLVLPCFILSAIGDCGVMCSEAGIYAQLLNTLVQILLTQMTAFALCKYQDARALFTGITASTYVLYGNVIGIAVHVYTGITWLSLLVALFLHAGLLLLMIWRLRLAYLRELDAEELPWRPLCLVPALFYLTTYAMIMWPSNLHRTPTNLASVMILLLLMLAFYVLVLNLLETRNRNANQGRNLAMLENYADSLRREAESLGISNEKNAIFRHDIRHYLQIMEEYLEKGQTDKLRETLGQITVSLESAKPEIYCENVAVNSIIADYAAQAKAQQITFICHADVPNELEVSEFELAVVCANLLSNALRAAGRSSVREKRICLEIQQVKGRMIMELRNSCKESLIRFDVDGIPISDQGKGHGYGMKSVMAFVQKYQSAFDCAIEQDEQTGERMFCVRILI